MINAPELAWPQGIEGFDSKATDDLYKGTVPVSGRKIFEFPFTVSKPGIYRLPAVEFGFFDVKDAQYKTIATLPIEVTVARGLGKPKMTIAETGSKPKRNYLTRFFHNRLRVVSLFAVLIILGLVFWLKRDRKKENQVSEKLVAKELKIVAANKIAEEDPVEEFLLAQDNPLVLAEECLQQDDANLFYTQLNLGLKNYLVKKLGIAVQDLSRKNIAEQIDLKGISNETSVKLQELIDEVEWQLYTPMTNHEKMKGMYERAHDLIQMINTCRS